MGNLRIAATASSRPASRRSGRHGRGSPLAPSRALGLSAALALTAGCGAKTGLLAPELPMDAAVRDVVMADVPSDAPAICVEARPDVTTPLTVDLQTAAQVAVADVLFVIDRTGSMDQEIANIRDGLRNVIVPGLIRSIPDLNLGVVTFADFPLEPYGSPDDRPFTLVRPLSAEFTALQGAIANIQVDNGGDNPEADVEALYQVATGEGLRPWIGAASGCARAGLGYACFRPRAEAVIVLISDAPMHNGPMGSQAYSRTVFPPPPAQIPHTYDQMIAALRANLHARVIGINSGMPPFWARDDMEQIARDTGSLGADNQPLVFDINPDGTGLSEQVVRSVERFTNEVVLNVSARAVDIDGSGGARMVRAIRPERATPMDRIARLDMTTFYGVVPGTQLVFALDLDRSMIVPMDREQRFTVRIEFLADGRPTLGFRDIQIIVPPRDTTCQSR